MLLYRSLVSFIIFSLHINSEASTTTFTETIKPCSSFKVLNCDCFIVKEIILNRSDNFQQISLTCKNLGDDFESGTFLKKLNSHLNGKEILYELNIMNSNFTFIPWNDIYMLKSIKLLSLNDGILSNITAFANFEKTNFLDLHYLNVSNNMIENIDSNTFIGFQLRILDLSHNDLEIIDEGLFDSQNQLHYLSLASNRLKKLPPFVFQNLTNLEILDISFNHISELSPNIFKPLEKLQKLSLAFNHLSIFSSDFSNNVNLLNLNLTGNPWHCNESISWISSLSRNVEVNMKELICKTPESLTNQTVNNALTIHKLWESINNTNTCQICSCIVLKGPHIVVVDCKRKGLNALPPRLPAKSRVVHLENNLISQLTMDHVNITEWNNVIYLYLSNNSLSSLNDIEGTVLVNNLVSLYLDHNKFQEISIHLLERFTLPVVFTFSKNSWECDCDTIRFQTWLQDHHKQVQDIHELYCGPSYSSTLRAKPIFRLAKSDLCPQPAPSLINYLDILNPILALLILTIIFKLSYDIYRHRHTGKFPVFWSFKLR